MELNGLFPIVRRWLAVILIATGVSTAIGLLLGSTADKTYEARAELLVGPLSTDSDTMRASGDLAQTYAQLATTDSVLGAVARDVDVPRAQLKDGVRATANSTTRFLVVRARGHDREVAAEIANSVSLQLLTLGKQDPSRPEGQLRVIDPARAVGTPVSPRLDLIVPLAAVAGLLGSLTLVLLFEFVGDTAESAEKVDAVTGVPTLVVKRRRMWPTSEEAARAPYRTVVTQADLAAPVVRCVLLTGVGDRDGTQDLALRLASVWAQRRRDVVLVDARNGMVSTLSSSGATTRRDTARSLAGPDAAESITVERALALVDGVAPEGTLVLVHAAPATVSAATLVWARVADVTVLSVRRFQARRSMISEAVVNLRAVGAHLAFSVLHERSRPSDVPVDEADDAPADHDRDPAGRDGEGIATRLLSASARPERSGVKTGSGSRS